MDTTAIDVRSNMRVYHPGRVRRARETEHERTEAVRKSSTRVTHVAYVGVYCFKAGAPIRAYCPNATAATRNVRRRLLLITDRRGCAVQAVRVSLGVVNCLWLYQEERRSRCISRAGRRFFRCPLENAFYDLSLSFCGPTNNKIIATTVGPLSSK